MAMSTSEGLRISFEDGVAIIDYGRFHDTLPRPHHGQTPLT